MENALKIQRRSRPKGIGTTLALVIFGFLLILPVLWLLLNSFKSEEELVTYPIRVLPRHFTLIRYLAVLQYQNVSLVLLRTFGLGISTAALTCLTSAMAGYAFARVNTRWRRPLFSVVIALLVVPSIIMLIPQFILYARYHIINTYWPWYLAALGATNPLYIFMYRQFFLGFPKELEEAAEIDGASPVGIFLRIILPNTRPALTTILIFAFSAVWGDFMMPMMFLNDPSKLMGTWLAGWPANNPYVLSLTVLYTLPVVLLFILIQKNIQKGMLFTGFRG